VVDPTERANFMGDIPALLIVGIALAILTPRARHLTSMATTTRAT